MTEQGWITVALIAACAGCIMTDHEDAASLFGLAAFFMVMLS